MRLNFVLVWFCALKCLFFVFILFSMSFMSFFERKYYTFCIFYFLFECHIVVFKLFLLCVFIPLNVCTFYFVFSKHLFSLFLFLVCWFHAFYLVFNFKDIVTIIISFVRECKWFLFSYRKINAKLSFIIIRLYISVKIFRHLYLQF